MKFEDSSCILIEVGACYTGHSVFLTAARAASEYRSARARQAFLSDKCRKSSLTASLDS